MKRSIDIICPICGLKIREAKADEEPSKTKFPGLVNRICERVDRHMKIHGFAKRCIYTLEICYERWENDNARWKRVKYAEITGKWPTKQPRKRLYIPDGVADFFNRIELEIELESLGISSRDRDIYRTWIRRTGEPLQGIADEFGMCKEAMKARIGRIHIARVDGWLEQEMNKI